MTPRSKAATAKFTVSVRRVGTFPDFPDCRDPRVEINAQ
jgi:hypothetical protein